MTGRERTLKAITFGQPDRLPLVQGEDAEIAFVGGFVFNAIHNVQTGTPTASVVAMMEAVRAVNGSQGGI